MRIFISYANEDNVIANKLSSILLSDGYDIFNASSIPFGADIYKYIGSEIAKADVFIIIVSKSSNRSTYVASEMAAILSLRDKGRMPLVIPIVIGKDTDVPIDIARFHYVVFPNSTDNSTTKHDQHEQLLDSVYGKDAIKKIELILSAHEEKLKTEALKKKKIEEKVQSGLSKYIEDVFENLKASEKRNRRLALGLYLISIISLIATVLIAVLFYTRMDFNIANSKYIVIFGIVSLCIIIMLVSLSKLLFTLAKSFMVEAIRCSDRIHAISFGKFFLDAYGEEATHEEVLKAFSSWNIDNGSTSFRTQSGDDFDPKFSDILGGLKKILQ